MTSYSKPTFNRIPILDYSLLTTGRKDEFVSQLRHTMIFVGFLYLANTPIESSLFDRVIEYAPRLFELPQEMEKDLDKKVKMLHWACIMAMKAVEHKKPKRKGVTPASGKFDTPLFLP